MKPLAFLSALALPLANAYLVNPPGAAAPGTTADCSGWIQQSYSLTCAMIEGLYGITEAQFEAWNPSVTLLGGECSLIPGFYYCVQVDFITISVPSPTPPTSRPTTTSAGNGITTPTPVQTGMVGNCNKFYFVVSGDGCYDIAAAQGIALNDFYSWNPAVKSDCSGLQAGYYVCVGTTGGAPSTTLKTTTTTTTAGNGITTPTPTQTGMVSNCNKFYLVVSGDGCFDIAAAKGIALTDFYSWNPAVKSDCSGLQAGVYVCVGTTTSTPTPTKTTTTTTAGNGITTPTPTQSGMVGNCNKFYKVVSGDGCYNIAAAQGIALSDFYSWNPAVKSDCSGLQANVYVCVGTTTSTPTPTKTTTTTTAGNGITTPTPTQSGMVGDCNKFYKVVSGDGCYNIAAAQGIALADFYSWNPAVKSDCSGLQANVYVCVGRKGSTAPANPTPTPVQSGMVSGCKKFHLVVSGDTCYDIAAAAGVSLANFYSWNPAVGTSCGTLQAGYYVCTGI